MQAIRALFDYLYTHQNDVAALNAAYPLRGILEMSVMRKATSKFTIYLSQKRKAQIPAVLQRSLVDHGLNEMF